MMFLSLSDWKSGAGGRSRVRTTNGCVLEVVVADSSNTRRVPAVSERAVMAWDSIRRWPRKVLWMMEDGVLRADGFCGGGGGALREPPRERCRLLRNQVRNSTGSDWWVSVKR